MTIDLLADFLSQEEIAKMMQAKRRKAEAESDYLIDGDAAASDVGPRQSSSELSTTTSDHGSRSRKQGDVMKLSASERSELLNRESPELLGLLSEVEHKLEELSLLGLALDEAHTHQSEHVTEAGLSYLELKHHLLLGYVMNVNMYLLLKAEAAEQRSKNMSGIDQGVVSDVRLHPVVDQLLKLQRALDKLKPLEKKGRKAVALLVQKAGEELFEGSEEDGEEEDAEEESDDDEEEEEEEEEQVEDVQASEAPRLEAGGSGNGKSAVDDKLSRRAAKTIAKARAHSRVSGGKVASSTKKSERKKKAALLGSDVGDIERDGAAVAAASSKLQVSGLRRIAYFPTAWFLTTSRCVRDCDSRCLTTQWFKNRSHLGRVPS
jgi:hypothetical protein